MAYSDYNYGTSARKFKESYEFSYDSAYNPALEIHAGGGRKKHRIPEIAVMAIKALVVFVVLFAGVGVCRISLSSVAVSAAIEAKEFNKNINEEREKGNTLEVEQSTLSNPTRIKAEATKLGLAAPEKTKFMVMSKDVVVTDEQGNLSLSGSVEAITKDK